MAKITVITEVMQLENGIYKGRIDTAAVTRSGKVLMKIELEDGTVFVSFIDAKSIGKYPFNMLFMAVGSDELDDIVGLEVEFQVENNTSSKTGQIFTNIRKINVIDRMEEEV